MEFLAENAVWGGLGLSEGKELHSPGTTMDQLNSSRAKFPLMWGVRDSRKRQEGRRGLGVFLPLHSPLGWKITPGIGWEATSGACRAWGEPCSAIKYSLEGKKKKKWIEKNAETC